MDSVEEMADDHGFSKKAYAVVLCTIFALTILSNFSASSAAQAAPPVLWNKCDADEPIGEQCSSPWGVAANSENGHVFVADLNNFRVVELNALGQFIRTWGWDVIEGGGTGFEICAPAENDECKAGTSGFGAGQFTFSLGVAVDSAGGVYVVDYGNQRVQKFDSQGNFLLMFGGHVNKTKVEEPGSTEAERNLCPFDPGDECQAGTVGTGKGQFGNWGIGDAIAVSSTDKVYVGDQERIQIFDTSGQYLEDFPEDPSGVLKESTVHALTIDAAGNLYVIYNGKFDVRKLTSGGVELGEPRFELTDNEKEPVLPTAVAVNSAGHVFAFGPTSCCGNQDNMNPIIEFDSTGKRVDEFGKGEFSGSAGMETNLCAESQAPGNLYVTNLSNAKPFVRAYGTEPVGCFKARTGKASSITENTARLNGTVNPDGALSGECRFEWGLTDSYGQVAPCVETPAEIGEGTKPKPVHADISGLQRGTVYHFRLLANVGGELETGSDETFKTVGPPVISGDHTVGATDTQANVKALVNPEGFPASYHFEYGLDTSYGKSTPEISIGSDRTDHPVAATLEGLSPGTTYHWRIVATNTALGNPVVVGADHSVTTYRSFAEAGSCPNQGLRTGPSAFLPDCRAYEMVSPVDKNGGDIVTGLPRIVDPAGYIQASPEGDKIAYTSKASFGDQANSFNFNQYVASRTGTGWSSAGIHPRVEGGPVSPDSFGLFREFMAFTPDLCNAWLVDFVTPAPTSDGQGGQPNLYRRGNCGAGTGSLEALMPEPPPLPEGAPQNYVDSKSVQGVSDDGRHAFFVAGAGNLQQCRTTNTTATVLYQWLRNGTPIEGATSPVYAPAAADAGNALQCQVFVITANAGSTQVANPAAVIPPVPGAKISPPVAPGGIAGPTPTPPGPLTVGGPGGQTLTCNPQAAEWQGSPSFSYQWYRNGAVIAGATSSTYLVSAADVATAAAFRCAVTGTNADGAVTKVSDNRLTNPEPNPKAPTASANMGSGGLYDRFGGENHLVSVLPNGRPAEAGVVGAGWNGNLENAVSGDGSRVYWTLGNKLYLRENPEQGITASECGDPTKACTRELTNATSGSALFWAATPDGSKALFSETALGGQDEGLFEFDLQKAKEGQPPRREIASDILAVAGQSEDLSHIYFISREALNEEAQAGAPNLYLEKEGALRFVVTLSELDLGNVEPGGTAEAYDVTALNPYSRAIRVSADGSRIVFDSRGQLTGFDNSEAESGKPAIEVFSYGAEIDKLVCVSCNPSGALPVGRELNEPYASQVDAHPTKVIAAAWIPTWEHSLHASNVLSEEGGRIFFNSIDPLLPRDGNGAQDVYEWEEAGVGGCKESSPSYFPENGGCLYLISSAEGSHEAEFWEASPDGEDVFFTTASSLLPQDPGLVDLYDARVGGGFPQPNPPAECEGEACQSPPPAPEFGDPASSAFSGPPNPPLGKKKSCPRGKHKVRRNGKTRCVKKGKKNKKQQRAQSNRRAGR